jgi:hypothetical protein
MMATKSTAVGQSQGDSAELRPSPPSTETRPDLGLIDRRQVVARARRRQARALIALASACLAVPLVLAAVGHAIVASDQVRSDALQTELAQALQTQQDYQLQRAELVNPTRILTIAETRLHMVTPLSVSYLPPVNPGESVAQAHEPWRVRTAAHKLPAQDGTASHRRSKALSVSGPTR